MEFYAEVFHHLRFAQALPGTRLVGSNPIGVEPSWHRVLVIHNHLVAPLGEVSGASERRRAGTEAGHTPAVERGHLEESQVVVESIVHSEALQASDFDG